MAAGHAVIYSGSSSGQHQGGCHGNPAALGAAHRHEGLAGGRRPFRGAEKGESLPTAGGKRWRLLLFQETIDLSSHCPPAGSGLAGGEAAHPEGGAGGPDAVCPSAVRLPGGQERRREEEGSGRAAHLHDAPGLRQDEQGHREAQSTEGLAERGGGGGASTGSGADAAFPFLSPCSPPPRIRWSPCWRRPEQ